MMVGVYLRFNLWCEAKIVSMSRRTIGCNSLIYQGLIYRLTDAGFGFVYCFSINRANKSRGAMIL